MTSVLREGQCKCSNCDNFSHPQKISQTFQNRVVTFKVGAYGWLEQNCSRRFSPVSFSLDTFRGVSWDYGQHIPEEKPLLWINSQMQIFPYISILAVTIDMIHEDMSECKSPDWLFNHNVNISAVALITFTNQADMDWISWCEVSL